MENFKEFCQNEGLGNVVKGVGNYLGKMNYDDEYWNLPQELKNVYDQSPNVRKYVSQLKQAKGIPLANAIQTYMQEVPAAERLSKFNKIVGQNRDPGQVQNLPFKFDQYGNQPGWKRYQA